MSDTEIVGVTLEINDKLSASSAAGGNLEASFWPTVAKKEFMVTDLPWSS